MDRTGLRNVVTALGALAATSLACAQDAAAAEAPQSASQETVFTLMMKGGPLMYPIFLCSFVIATAAIERLISLRRSRIGTPDLVDDVEQALPSRAAAATTSEEVDVGDTLIGRVLQAGVGRLHRNEEHAEAALEEIVTKEMHLLDRRLRPFSIVANLAPLLGLLGTVLGMILCFGEASAAESTERAQKLSDGIYRALVTTAAGLSVAIPAMVLNYYFKGRGDRVIDSVEEASSRFLEFYYGDDAVPEPEGQSAHRRKKRDEKQIRA